MYRSVQSLEVAVADRVCAGATGDVTWRQLHGYEESVMTSESVDRGYDGGRRLYDSQEWMV